MFPEASINVFAREDFENAHVRFFSRYSSLGGTLTHRRYDGHKIVIPTRRRGVKSVRVLRRICGIPSDCNAHWAGRSRIAAVVTLARTKTYVFTVQAYEYPRAPEVTHSSPEYNRAT